MWFIELKKKNSCNCCNASYERQPASAAVVTGPHIMFAACSEPQTEQC